MRVGKLEKLRKSESEKWEINPMHCNVMTSMRLVGNGGVSLPLDLKSESTETEKV